MWHQSHYVVLAVTDTRDVRQRTVRIRGGFLMTFRCSVAKHDLAFALKLGEGRLVAKIISFGMRNRHFQHLPGFGLDSERRVRSLDANVYLPADKAQTGVAREHTRQQARFAKNLKAVADAEDKSAGAREFLHRAHHGRKPRNRARAQVIAISKPAGQNDGVKTSDLFGLMPQEFNRLMKDLAQGVVGVVVTVRAREHDHTEFHRASSPLIRAFYHSRQAHSRPYCDPGGSPLKSVRLHLTGAISSAAPR